MQQLLTLDMIPVVEWLVLVHLQVVMEEGRSSIWRYRFEDILARFDYIYVADGQCDSPSSGSVATTATNDRYCGTELKCAQALSPAVIAGPATMCTMTKPFKIGVFSDGLEYINPTTASEGILANNRGFSISINSFNYHLSKFFILGYYQKTSCLTRP